MGAVRRAWGELRSEAWLWRRTWRWRLPAAVWRRVAFAAPRGLVYFCGIRLMSHATTGPWSHEEAPAVPGMLAIERWDKQYHGRTTPPYAIGFAVLVALVAILLAVSAWL